VDERRREGEGEGRQACSIVTGTETVETLCHRVEETQALPAAVSLTIVVLSWSRLFKSPGF
jgi:hypothetical protein